MSVYFNLPLVASLSKLPQAQCTARQKRTLSALGKPPPPKRVKSGQLSPDYRQMCKNATRDILMTKVRKMTVFGNELLLFVIIWWPLVDILVTTWWPLGVHLVTTRWPLVEHLVTTFFTFFFWRASLNFGLQTITAQCTVIKNMDQSTIGYLVGQYLISRFLTVHCVLGNDSPIQSYWRIPPLPSE